MSLIWKILSNERGQSPWASGFGGLMQGLAQGFQLREDHERKKELLKLEQARIKLAEQEANLKGEAFKQAVTQHAAANDFADQLANAGQPAQAPQADYQMGGQFSDVQQENQGLKRSMIGTPPMGSQQLMAGLIKSGQGAHLGGLLTQQAGQADMEKQLQLMQRYGLIGQGSSGTPVQMIPSMGNKGMTLRGHVHDPGVGVQSQQYDQLQRENPGADSITLNQKLSDLRKTQSQATGAGSAQGRLDVTSSPAYLQNTTDVATARTQGSPLPAGVEDAIVKGNTLQKLIGDVKANFDPSFLGAVQGTDTAFDVRRRLPSSVSGLTEKETKFRQSLADARNQIVYLMSGKQINESEGKRLNQALPAATDTDPFVFLSGLNRFEELMNTIVAGHKQAGSTTRGQLSRPPSGGGMAPPPTGWRR